MNIKFEKPVFKKTYYISRTNTPIYYDLIDITIKKAQRLKDKGFIFTLNVPEADHAIFKEIDETGIYCLLANNYNWFSNDLSEDDIKSMYTPSLCRQNNTINVYIKSDAGNASYASNASDASDAYVTSGVKIKVNDKAASIREFMKIISDLSYAKKHTINMQVYHTGLYIYSGQTMHKWGLKAINVYSIEDNILNDDDFQHIEDYWGEIVSRCEDVLSERIKECENTRTNIKTTYSQILQEKKSNKDWESKIMELKKIIQTHQLI